jgi:Domain of unknown function (DUF5753)
VGPEAEASGLCGYEPDVIHGLLQTADYAQTVLRELRPRDSQEQIRRVVDLRMQAPGGVIYLEKDREVRACTEAFDRMRAAALSPAASVELIQWLARELI